jgi:putative component of membrane protein insertase Oxa1/YidC/SpoIIIJ protein YidD
MKPISAIFVLFFAFLFLHDARAQTRQDAQDFSTLIYKENPATKDYTALAQNNHSVEEYVFSQVFLFYKNFISSQDGNICTFYPSCSEYGLQSIKKKGIVVGLISGFDRLSRCNGLERDKYHIHNRSRKLYDPVD